MDTMTCLRFIIAPGVGQINENLLFITNQIAAFVGEHDVFRKQCLPCRLYTIEPRTLRKKIKSALIMNMISKPTNTT